MPEKKDNTQKLEGEGLKYQSHQADRRDSRGSKPQRKRERQPDDGFDSRILNIRRVARMYKGGRRLRMSVFVAVGDQNGRVGLGLGKGADVSMAQSKAVEHAKKNLSLVQLKGATIPHESLAKYRSSRVMLKPAAPGTGVVAGATVKAVMELAGVKDVLTKVHGSTNPVNSANAALVALKLLRSSRI